MLDLGHMAQTISRLQNAASGQAAAGAAAAREIPNIEGLMLKLKAEERASAPNLIEMGLGLLGDLLRTRL
jgi:hypothetical protein